MPGSLTDLAIERLRRLPQHPEDVFELAVIQVPKWVGNRGGEPFRPVIALARDRLTGTLAGTEPVEPGGFLRFDPFEAISRLAVNRRVGHRPAAVAMRDPALAGALRERLERLGIAIEPVSRLPLIDAAVADMTHELTGDSPLNGYLDQRSVTVERLRAFADAAADFYRAAIWNHLSGEDLVRVESAAPERSLA